MQEFLSWTLNAPEHSAQCLPEIRWAHVAQIETIKVAKSSRGSENWNCWTNKVKSGKVKCSTYYLLEKGQTRREHSLQTYPHLKRSRKVKRQTHSQPDSILTEALFVAPGTTFSRKRYSLRVLSCMVGNNFPPLFLHLHPLPCSAFRWDRNGRGRFVAELVTSYSSIPRVSQWLLTTFRFFWFSRSASFIHCLGRRIWPLHFNSNRPPVCCLLLSLTQNTILFCTMSAHESKSRS